MLQKATPVIGNIPPLFPSGKIETLYASRITIPRVVVPRIRARKVYTPHTFRTDRQTAAHAAAGGTTEHAQKARERSAKTEIVEIYIPDSRHIRA